MTDGARGVRASCRALIALAFVLVLMGPGASHAATITFGFQGTGTVIGDTLFGSGLGSTRSFTGTFTLEDGDLNPANPSIGQYDCSGCALPSWTLDLGGLVVAGNGTMATVTTAGQFQVLLHDASTPGIQPNSRFIMILGYAPGFSDDSLPGAIPFPLASQSNRMEIYATANQLLWLFPVLLEPLESPPTSVPEPGALLLVGVAALALARKQGPGHSCRSRIGRRAKARRG